MRQQKGGKINKTAKIRRKERRKIKRERERDTLSSLFRSGTTSNMVNVRCLACQVKYRILAAKNTNLLDCHVPVPVSPEPRFPYRAPKLRKPRSYNRVSASPGVAGCLGASWDALGSLGVSQGILRVS